MDEILSENSGKHPKSPKTSDVFWRVRYFASRTSPMAECEIDFAPVDECSALPPRRGTDIPAQGRAKRRKPRRVALGLRRRVAFKP